MAAVDTQGSFSMRSRACAASKVTSDPVLGMSMASNTSASDVKRWPLRATCSTRMPIQDSTVIRLGQERRDGARLPAAVGEDREHERARQPHEQGEGEAAADAGLA